MPDLTLDEIDCMMRALPDLRLHSFDYWPATFMDPERMAGAGFYFTGRGDMVRCPFCRIGIGGWQYTDDDPLQRHTLLNPSCTYINPPGADL
jgi:hypothetical protein